jgi:hypothetical protein
VLKGRMSRLSNLEDAWYTCHKKILTLDRDLNSPIFILYKREKARLECLIDIEKSGKVSTPSRLCYDFWKNQPINLDPVDSEFLES